MPAALVIARNDPRTLSADGGVPTLVQNTGRDHAKPYQRREPLRGLPRVQCPQAPFNGSTDENVCAGL